ncbi:hypothetical protein EYF80_030600 [Liparis tanakae]|uniref:Uncharacterized protein n=1 Tax=Liparis tanakae TaxID=230148 RepID=A0A4Z2H117_9TELE|nr:hypothetical protein EYF80_030600 [Liparis tanakae]
MRLVVCSREEALTDTLPGVSVEAGAVVALQSSVAVAGEHLRAGLASLPGAHLAAPAAIRHQWDPCGALGGRTGAEAGSVAPLAQHLQGGHMGTGTPAAGDKGIVLTKGHHLTYMGLWSLPCLQRRVYMCRCERNLRFCCSHRVCWAGPPTHMVAAACRLLFVLLTIG